jgi:hypothetical protein
MAERIGDFLIRIGAITQAQLDDVLAIQKNGDSRAFGLIALDQGYVTEAAIEQYAAAQKIQQAGPPY